MRTEQDLRDALTSLESQGPVAVRVLPGRKAMQRRRYRKGGLVACAALAATLAVVMVAIPTPSHVSVQAGHAGARLDLQAKLLAALESTKGDIVFFRTLRPNEGNEVEEDWCGNCLDPRNGTVVRDRTLILNPNGTRYEESVLSYTQNPSLGLIPHSMKNNQDATWGRMLDVRYYSRTWDIQKQPLLAATNPSSGADIRQEVATGGWKQIGSGTVDGQAALKLQNPHAGSFEIYLWVNAQSYAPIRVVTLARGAIFFQTDFRLLPDTLANQALLKVTIPPGFRHAG